MKTTTKMSRATAQIERMFRSLNDGLFDGMLPTPILHFHDQHKSRTSTEEKWESQGELRYEIGLSIDVINFSIEELTSALLHEMIHLYCHEIGIQDTSRGGTYHNGKFKDVAESYGLICSKDEKRGWTTTPSEELVDFIADQGWNEIQIFREENAVETEQKDLSQKTLFLYGCPQCGPRIQATRNVGFLCTCGAKLLRMKTAENTTL